MVDVDADVVCDAATDPAIRVEVLRRVVRIMAKVERWVLWRNPSPRAKELRIGG